MYEAIPQYEKKMKILLTSILCQLGLLDDPQFSLFITLNSSVLMSFAFRRIPSFDRYRNIYLKVIHRWDLF
jgi:hypothetical protein